jgi:DNA-binding transcriptional LysR family regulator
MMNLSLLTTFLAVAETGSFTGAARAIFVTQPAISQHVRALEEKLGVTLFIRHGQRTHLTPQGEELRRHARAIMKAVEEAEVSLTEMSALKRGRMRIGATMYMAYLLPAVLMEFKRRHPLVQIDVRFHNSARVIQLVDEGAVDFGFAGGMSNVPSSLTVTPIHVERLVLAAPPNHPLAAKRQVRPADLREHLLAVREPGTYTRRRVEEWFGSEPLPQNLIEVGRIEAALQLAVNGCLTFVPEGTIRGDVRAGRLVALRTRGMTTELEYNLYLFGIGLPSVAARIFLELLAGLPVLTKAETLRALVARI